MPDPGNDRVPVQLKVFKPVHTYPGHPSQYHLAVTGPGLQLGFDDPDKAPRCKLVGRDLWMKEIWLPRNTTISYKFLVVHSSYYSMRVVDVENFAPRILHVYDRPIIVECHFNTNRQKITHGKDNRTWHNIKTPRYLKNTRQGPQSPRPAVVPDVMSIVPETAVYKRPTEKVNHNERPALQNDVSCAPTALLSKDVENVDHHSKSSTAEEVPSQHIKLLSAPIIPPVWELIEPKMTIDKASRSLVTNDVVNCLPDVVTTTNPVVSEIDAEDKTDATLVPNEVLSMETPTKAVLTDADKTTKQRQRVSPTTRLVYMLRELLQNELFSYAIYLEKIWKANFSAEKLPCSYLALTKLGGETPPSVIKDHIEKQPKRFVVNERGKSEIFQLHIYKNSGPLINKLDIAAEIEIRNDIKTITAQIVPATKAFEKALVAEARGLGGKRPMLVTSRGERLQMMAKLKGGNVVRVSIMAKLEVTATVMVLIKPRAANRVTVTVQMMTLQRPEDTITRKMIGLASAKDGDTGTMTTMPRAVDIATINLMTMRTRAADIVVEKMMAMEKIYIIAKLKRMTKPRASDIATVNVMALPKAEDITALKMTSSAKTESTLAGKAMAINICALKMNTTPRVRDSATVKMMALPKEENTDTFKMMPVARTQWVIRSNMMEIQIVEHTVTSQMKAISRVRVIDTETMQFRLFRLNRVPHTAMDLNSVSASKDYLYLKRPVIFRHVMDFFILQQQLRENHVAKMESMIQNHLKTQLTSSILCSDNVTCVVSNDCLSQKKDTSSLLLRINTDTKNYRDLGTSVDLVGLPANDNHETGDRTQGGSRIKNTKLFIFLGIAIATAKIAYTYFIK